jgi:predicted RNA-binding Zn ribbon-like protein
MSADDRLAFEFGGRLCLDFTWTLRFRAVYPTELLRGPDQLAAWLLQAGLPSGGVRVEQLEAARVLREAIYSASLASATGTSPLRRDVATINRAAAVGQPFPTLLLDGSKTLVTRRGHETDAGLAVVAADAIDLLSLRDGRLRRCEGPRCALLFHDTSRPGNRRWCSAERCGNKVNTKNYRTRLDPPHP